MGGRFFAYLPSFIVFLFNMGLGLISKNFQWFFLLGVIIIAVRVLLLVKFFRKSTNALFQWFYRFVSRYLMFFQIMAGGVFLWLFLHYSISIVAEQNWLFRELGGRTFWLVDISSEASYQRQLYFAKLVTFMMISLIIWGALENIRHQSKGRSISALSQNIRAIISVTSLVFILLQVIYLPVNYGILLFDRKFPVVQIRLRNSENFPLLSRQHNLALLHKEGRDYFLYSPPKRRLWQVQRDEMTTLLRFGQANIFDSKYFLTSATEEQGL